MRTSQTELDWHRILPSPLLFISAIICDIYKNSNYILFFILTPFPTSEYHTSPTWYWQVMTREFFNCIQYGAKKVWPSLFPEQTWLQLTIFIIPGSHTLDKTTSGNKMIKRGRAVNPSSSTHAIRHQSGWRVTRWCTSLRGVLSPLQWWCTGHIVPDRLHRVHCTVSPLQGNLQLFPSSQINLLCLARSLCNVQKI